MYQIAFYFNSPIAIMNNITLDALLSYCEFKEFYNKKDIIIKSYTSDDIIRFDLKSIKYKYGVPLCSYGVFGEKLESIVKWRKRWESKYDYLVNFGKKKKRIRTGAGFYKSYDTPLLIISVKKIIFYFQGDVDLVDYLVKTHLFSIGKKRSIGYGWVSEYKIKEVKTDIKKLYYRPLPNTEEVRNFLNKYNISFHTEYISLIYPYWDNKNFQNCIVIDF